MSFAELELLPVLLRVATYAGTIAVAGSVLLRMTLATWIDANLVRRQILLGALLLAICEPLRYALFQLAIAQGDAALAFDPSMRWVGMDTPLGQAALVRLAGVAIVLLGVVTAVTPLAIGGAVLLVASYLVEGHTASAPSRPLLAPVLFVHLLVVHWWFGALLPMQKMLGDHDISNATVVKTVRRFGQQAVLAVVVLVAAGALLFGSLVQWRIDLASAYQQGFALKIGAFLLVLLVAAVNKLRLTALLSAKPELGRRLLHRSISVEIGVAVLVLTATALALSFPPTDH